MDLLVRGGLVVDGTGEPARLADVRVRDGRIAEVGPGLRSDGEKTIDASGAYVSPGFIDIHTHVDASIFWDPSCDPMPQHGVTSVLSSSCGLSFAPCRPERRRELASLFCYIEDIPEEALEATTPWTWERHPELLAEIDRRTYAVNVGTMVGHTPLRLYVMGDEAWERAATEAERAQIAELAAECLDGGAFAMSTSQGFDEDRNKRLVPSRIADDAELEALIDVVADRGRFIQFIADVHARRTAASVRRVAEMCRRRGVTNTWINVMHDDQMPDHALSLMDVSAQLQAEGSPCFPQISPRPMDMRINWFGGMSFMSMKATWHPMVQTIDPEAKAAMLRDEQWRAAARIEWDKTPFTMLRHKRPECARLLTVSRPENSRWVGRTFADLIAARGGHPSDVLADWLLDNDLRPGLLAMGVANGDPDGVAALLKHPAGVFANSDAAAHVQMFSAVGDSTLMLATYTRDRGDFTVEQAVHKMTGQLADRFGFEGRGVIAPGAIADLAVFALEELHFDTEVFVEDLPLGASRLRRPPGGYRTTVVGGTVTQEHGELTGELPGRLLRKH